MNGSTSKHIRMYCDGELGPDEAARLEREILADPSRRAGVEFERKLRDRVRDVLRDEPVPAGLSDRVRALAGEARDPAAATPSQTRRRSWWQGPQRANVFAVAASLALVAGAVIFGVFGRPIDAWRPVVFDAATAAAAAVAGEHADSATRGSALTRALPFATRDAATAGLAGPLGGSAVADLEDLGYTFVGGAPCKVPRCELGCHLVYRRTGDRALIFLHVVPEKFAVRGESVSSHLPIPTDVVSRGPTCRMDVLIWNHGERSYLLTACAAQDLEMIAKRFQRPILGDPGPP